MLSKVYEASGHVVRWLETDTDRLHDLGCNVEYYVVKLQKGNEIILVTIQSFVTNYYYLPLTYLRLLFLFCHLLAYAFLLLSL
jgi:hypothetical protein